MKLENSKSLIELFNFERKVGNPHICTQTRVVTYKDEDTSFIESRLLPYYLLWSPVGDSLVTKLKEDKKTHNRETVLEHLKDYFSDNNTLYHEHIDKWYKDFEPKLEGEYLKFKESNNIFIFDPTKQHDLTQYIYSELFLKRKNVLGGSAALSWRGTVYRESETVHDFDCIHFNTGQEEFIKNNLKEFNVISINKNLLLLTYKEEAFYNMKYSKGVLVHCEAGNSTYSEGVITGDDMFRVDLFKAPYTTKYKDFDKMNDVRIQMLSEIFRTKIKMKRQKDLIDYFHFEHWQLKKGREPG